MSYRETVAEQDFWVLVLCPASGSQNNFERTTNGQIQKRKKIPRRYIYTSTCMLNGHKNLHQVFVDQMILKFWNCISHCYCYFYTAENLETYLAPKPDCDVQVWHVLRGMWSKHLLSMPTIDQPRHESQQPLRLSPRNTSRGCGSTTDNILHNIIRVDKVLVLKLGDAGFTPSLFLRRSFHISQECSQH